MTGLNLVITIIQDRLHMPLVSVIIPAYNAEDYISQCLSSVLSQTLSDIEVIVVDDGSTDRTASIVEELTHRDGRIRLIRQENQCAGVARNKGMEVAEGKYLYFLDADDWIELDSLEKLCSSAESLGSDIVVARSEGFDNQTGETWLIDYALNGVPFDTLIRPSFYADRLFQRFMGWPWDKLYRAEFIQSSGLLFQPLRTTNDAYFVFCSLMLAGGVSCVDKVFFHHRANNRKSLEGTRSKSWHCAIEAMWAIAKKIAEQPESTRLMESYNNWVLNYSYWSLNTLPADIADLYLEELAPALSAMPNGIESYVSRHEWTLRTLASLNQSKLLVKATDLSGDKENLSHEIANLQAEIVRLNGELNSLREELANRDSKIKEVYSSHSYKLGHALLTPLSAVKHRGE
ncbi:glycosyltransferase [Parolsenella catena]|uniref:glycosyltransferase n=2 Tax=Parolsenella catena TaxID=2003188 RepID=UPI0031B59470